MALGQSREQVGALVGGVSKTTVGRWEDARTLPSFERASALAAWLGVDVEQVTAMMRGEEPVGLRDSDLRTTVRELVGELRAMHEMLDEMNRRVTELDARYARLADAAIESLRRRPGNRGS